MKKKFILFFSFILIMSFGVFNIFAEGSGEPSITVSSAEGKRGDTVSVSVSIENNPGISTARLAVYYDDGLTLVKATDSGLLADGVFGGDFSENPYYLTWDDSVSDKDNAKNGVIATLEFRINADAAPGEHEIVIGYAPDDIYNLDFENIEFKSVIGSVNVVVERVPVTGISLDKTTATAVLSDKIFNLYPSVFPETATDKGIIWQTSDPQIATVTGGAVRLLKEGSVTITAITEDGGFTASCDITVICMHVNLTEYPEVESTCTQNGHSAYTICNDCGKIIAGDASPLPLAQHKGGKATCSSLAVCEVCGEIYGAFDENNHEDTEIVGSVDPTCSKEGYTGDKVCKGCKKIIEKGRAIEKTAHTYREEIIPATPDSKGYTLHVCTVCGYEYKDNYTEYVPILYGDVNGDGVVNGKDRLDLTRWLANWPEYVKRGINERNSDLDDNGRVNGKDRQILTRYLAKWAGYTELPYIGK